MDEIRGSPPPSCKCSNGKLLDNDATSDHDKTETIGDMSKLVSLNFMINILISHIAWIKRIIEEKGQFENEVSKARIVSTL